jgi:RNA polymerase sigma-70 factor (ECF subfamily)
MRRDSNADRTAKSHAIEGLVARFGMLLGALRVRYRLSPAEADELAQDLRIRLWHALEARPGEPPSTAYVKQAATSAALDLLRRRRRARVDAAVEPSAAPRRTPVAMGRLGTPELDVEADERATLVWREVERLDPPRDLAVRLYLAGYDRFEVARLAGWTEAKARNLIYRGLADLRARLEGLGIHR